MIAADIAVFGPSYDPHYVSTLLIKLERLDQDQRQFTAHMPVAWIRAALEAQLIPACLLQSNVQPILQINGIAGRCTWCNRRVRSLLSTPFAHTCPDCVHPRR